MESPGLMRDPRAIPILKEIVNSINHYLSKKEFRAFAKSLRMFFSTKGKYRDTSGVKDTEIRKIIIKSAKEVGILGGSKTKKSNN